MDENNTITTHYYINSIHHVIQNENLAENVRFKELTEQDEVHYPKTVPKDSIVKIFELGPDMSSQVLIRTNALHIFNNVTHIAVLDDGDMLCFYHWDKQDVSDAYICGSITTEHQMVTMSVKDKKYLFRIMNDVKTITPENDTFVFIETFDRISLPDPPAIISKHNCPVCRFLNPNQYFSFDGYNERAIFLVLGKSQVPCQIFLTYEDYSQRKVTGRFEDFMGLVDETYDQYIIYAHLPGCRSEKFDYPFYTLIDNDDTSIKLSRFHFNDPDDDSDIVYFTAERAVMEFSNAISFPFFDFHMEESGALKISLFHKTGNYVDKFVIDYKAEIDGPFRRIAKAMGTNSYKNISKKDLTKIICCIKRFLSSNVVDDIYERSTMLLFRDDRDVYTAGDPLVHIATMFYNPKKGVTQLLFQRIVY